MATLFGARFSPILIVALCVTAILGELWCVKATLAERQDALKPINWIQRGVEAEGRGNIDEALEDFTEAIRSNSFDPNAYYDRALLLSKLSRYDEALRDARSSVGLGRTFADGFALLAHLNEKTARYDDALAAIETAITLRPSEMTYKLLRADILSGKGSFEKAAAQYDDVLRSDAANTGALYGAARISLLQGDADRASRYLAKLQQKTSPEDPDVVRVAANMLLSAKRPDAVLQLLSRYHGDDSRLIEYRAQALAETGHADEALALLRSRKTSVYGSAVRGQIALASHDCPDAVKAFRETLSSGDPQPPFMWRNLGIASLCSRMLPEAFSAFSKAIELDQRDALSYRYRADTQRAYGNLEASIEDARQALALGGEDAAILMMLGVDEYRTGNRRIGKEHYADGCKLLPPSDVDKRRLCAAQLPRM